MKIYTWLVLALFVSAGSFAKEEKNKTKPVEYKVEDILESCAALALTSTAKKFDEESGNYRHLYGLNVTSGDLGAEGVYEYVVTYGNDEDGNVDIKVSVEESFPKNAKEPVCVLKSEPKVVEQK